MSPRLQEILTANQISATRETVQKLGGGDKSHSQIPVTTANLIFRPIVLSLLLSLCLNSFAAIPQAAQHLSPHALLTQTPCSKPPTAPFCLSISPTPIQGHRPPSHKLNFSEFTPNRLLKPFKLVLERSNPTCVNGHPV